MISRFFKRQKPRVFLGTLSVVSRTDIKRHIDQWGAGHNVNLDDPLHATLREIFALPLACEVSDPATSDLGLDVRIPDFQLGDYWDIALGEIGLPVFWRPKITVACRLYHLQTQKTERSFSVTQKMPWGVFLGRMFTWRALVRWRPPFDADDMNRLLYLACHRLLDKLRKST